MNNLQPAIDLTKSAKLLEQYVRSSNLIRFNQHLINSHVSQYSTILLKPVTRSLKQLHVQKFSTCQLIHQHKPSLLSGKNKKQNLETQKLKATSLHNVNSEHNTHTEPEKKSLWRSYKAISPRYRIILGLIMMGISFAGLQFSDDLEEKFPQNTENSGLGLKVPGGTLDKIEKSK
ncbi:hypothetical protein BB561_003450 [Smittium simulii]|uniref:Uncharacterized protein n=1 Tax=Smittium simulii TaxID=133385 RepID=A0A2T9YLA0_9FUNG|nr:hypothetical protein BB561_003450 [Smittium simulii]